MGSTNRKALIYDPYWDSLGGGEKYMATIAKVLADSNFAVDIYWPTNISQSVIDRFGIDLTSCHFVTKYSTHEYDLVFWNSDGSLPFSLAKKTFINMQFPHHGVSGHSLKNIIKSKFYTFLTNSKFTKEIIDREYWVKSQVLYPPIRTNDFKIGPKFKQILYVARFSNLAQVKGHEILIQSFKNIYKQIPEWKLILAGNTNIGTTDESFAKLKNLAADLPVEFVINPDLTDLKKLYSRASIFWSASGYGIDQRLHPEKAEHFGMTVVEAMSAGCVPIIVNLGGHPEIVTNTEDGFLWDEPRMLEKLTLDLISDTQKISYLSKLAQNKASVFDEDKFKVKLLELI